MSTTRIRPRSTRALAAGVMAVAALGLTACGEDEDTAGTETGASVEDVQEGADEDAAGPYDGVYDSSFYDDVESYDGETVTLSADVNEVLTPTSFTIAGTDDTEVEELLVVSADASNDLAADLTVEVTGMVHDAFDLTTAEEDLGTDLDDALYEDWDGEPFVEATLVDTSVASDQ